MRKAKSIWVVEDDKYAQSFYNDILGPQYLVSMFDDLNSLRRGLTQQALPDLLIADLHLPDGSFLNFFGEKSADAIRSLPFMVVSVLDDVDAVRNCFREQARDYISKPFPRAELIAKVERIFNGRELDQIQVDVDYQIKLHPTSLTISHNGKRSEELTAKEYKIVALMLKAPGRSLAKQSIKHHIWQGAKVSRRSLDQHLLHIRQKITPLGLEIVYSDFNYILKTSGEG
ncbi:MAG: response regulator transcription factor [Oligoflexales bacterium]